MKIQILLLCGAALVSSAGAQSNPASVEFLPLPESLPRLMFAPDPLAGTLLRPLSDPDVPVVDSAGPATGQAMSDEPVVTGATAATAPDAAGSAENHPPAEIPVEPSPAEAATSEAEPAVEPGSTTEPAITTHPTVPQGSTITVIVENVENNEGVVNVAVCDKGLSREGCPYDKAIQAAPGFVETKFEGIAPGTYAVVGYHDVNGNDVFDKFLGVPREPYALSSHAAESLVPTFADAALQIKEGENVVIIRLKRFGGG